VRKPSTRLGGVPKGWMLVVLLNRGGNSGGKDRLVATAEAGGKLPVGCPAWRDPAVVVPVVPFARSDGV
jgi:hypothetical protein